MSQNQISSLDFALFFLFKASLYYLGGGEPVLTPDITVADTCKRLLFICWLPIIENKPQSNSIFIIFFGFTKCWSLLSAFPSAPHHFVSGDKRFTPALLRFLLTGCACPEQLGRKVLQGLIPHVRSDPALNWKILCTDKSGPRTESCLDSHLESKSWVLFNAAIIKWLLHMPSWRDKMWLRSFLWKKYQSSFN